MSESHSISGSIPVSSLARAYRCPRQYYFSRHKPVTDSGRYTICKQVSLADPENLDENILWEEISLIHPDISPGLREYLADCIAMLSRMPSISYTETDLMVRSEKTGIHGQIDKYDSLSGEISIIRCSGAPAAGCWPDDRVRMAAYLLCFQETTGKKLPGGYIEYIPDGVVRFCEPQPRDRRALLQALKHARQVENGDLPGIPIKAPCRNCRYIDRCSPPTVKKLSEILFQKRE